MIRRNRYFESNYEGDATPEELERVDAVEKTASIDLNLAIKALRKAIRSANWCDDQLINKLGITGSYDWSRIKRDLEVAESYLPDLNLRKYRN